MAVRATRRPVIVYCLRASLLLIAYAAVAIAPSSTKDWANTGPLALKQPAISQPLPGAINPNQALDDCFPAADRGADKRYKVVGGYVDGRPYYACYQIEAATGYLFEVKGVEGAGFPIKDAGIFRRGARGHGAAWPQVPQASSPEGRGWPLCSPSAGSTTGASQKGSRGAHAGRGIRRAYGLWPPWCPSSAGWRGAVADVSWAKLSRTLMPATLCYAGAFFVFAVVNAAVVSDQWALASCGFLTIRAAYDLGPLS